MMQKTASANYKDANDDELADRLMALHSQEDTNYKPMDYLMLYQIPDNENSRCHNSHQQKNATLRNTQQRIDRSSSASPRSVQFRRNSSSESESSNSSIKIAKKGIFNESWREKICQWLYKVIDHFQYDREIVSLALNYLDRHLTQSITRSSSDSAFDATSSLGEGLNESHDCDTEMTPNHYRLAAMVALNLALKVHRSTTIHASDLLQLGNGNGKKKHPNQQLYNEQDLISMEKLLLTSLSWRLCPPTPLVFMQQYIELIFKDAILRCDGCRSDRGSSSSSSSVECTTSALDDAIAKVTNTAKFLIELSVCDYYFAHRRPSSIAYASCIIAIMAYHQHRGEAMRVAQITTDSTCIEMELNPPPKGACLLLSPQIMKVDDFLTRVRDVSGKEICVEVQLCESRLRQSYEEIYAVQ